jgi:hypothetical protein
VVYGAWRCDVGLLPDAGDWRWSSARAHLSGRDDYGICESKAVPATPWAVRRLWRVYSERSVAGSACGKPGRPSKSLKRP